MFVAHSDVFCRVAVGTLREGNTGYSGVSLQVTFSASRKLRSMDRVEINLTVKVPFRPAEAEVDLAACTPATCPGFGVAQGAGLLAS